MPNSNATGDILWEEFKVLICKLYELYGGDCDDLDWGDEGDEGEAAVAQVKAKFDADGTPTFATPQEEQDYRDLLDDLEQNAANPSTPPTAAAKTATQNMVNDMRAALPPA